MSTSISSRGGASACRLLLLLASTLLAWRAAAQPAPLPPEVFFKPAEVLEASLSPSGRRVALTSTLAGGRVGLFVWEPPAVADPARAEGAQAAATSRVFRTAHFTDVDIRHFQWVDDNRLVFSLIDRSEGSAQPYAPGLYVVKHDGSDPRELVARQGRSPFTTPRAGRESLPWNHVLLAVPQGGGDEVLVGRQQVVGGELVAVQPLWLSLTSGRTRDASAGGPSGAIDWRFDSRGEARVAVVRRDGRQQVHWRGPGESHWRLLDDSAVMSTRFWPSFVDDSGNLYVVRTEGPAALQVLARWDFVHNRPDQEPFVSVPGFDFAGTPVIARSSGGASSTLIGLHILAETETSHWFDARLKRAQQIADARLPGYVNRLQCARCGEDDMVVLVRAYSDRDPGHLWLHQPAAAASSGPAGPAAEGRWQRIAHARPAIDPVRMARTLFERIRARDGRELPVWLTVPPGRKPGDKGPAVVLVHGGPWVRGGSWHWRGLEQFLASRGYLVVAPEFRGSSGYGVAHQEAGFKQWGLAMQDDVADAAHWAAAQGWADRFCIAGASYGGYSTLMGLVRDPQLYRCGVAWVAVADPLLYLEGSWWIDDDISRDGRRYSLPRMVGDPVRDAEQLKAASPVAQAARIRAPLLLAYGERDRRVPLAHGERLRSAMRDAGLDPQWVTYPGEGHSWLKTETHVDFARRFEAFLQQHLAAPK